MAPVRCRIRITSPGKIWLLAAAAAAAAGLLKNINLILLMAYFLLGLFVLNFVYCRRSIRGIVLRRGPPRPVFAGEHYPCDYEIENSGSRAAHELVIEDSLFGISQRLPLPRLAPSSAHCAIKSCVPLRRGVYESSAFAVVCGAPFGLVEARKAGQGATTIWVYPRRGTLHLDRLRSSLPAGGFGRERRRSTVRQLADGTDFHGLRPFRTGDSPRWIHWKSTARVGTPMIREFDRSSAPGLVAVLDTGWAAEDSTGQRFESALELLTTLVWNWSATTESPLTLALPESDGATGIHEIKQRWHAHAILRRMAALNFAVNFPPVERGLYHELADRAPVLWVGGPGPSDCELPMLAIDPQRIGDIYRPPNGLVS